MANYCVHEVCQIFAAPDMASKNYVRHGIDYPVVIRTTDAMTGIVFDAMSCVLKLSNFIPAINYTTSAYTKDYEFATLKRA